MGYKILIVDDQNENLECMELFLSHTLEPSPKVTKANSGKEAIDLLRITGFDLIITDLDMPNSDGFFLMKEKLSLKDHTPVIVWSSQVNINSNAFSSLGASLFIPKLFSLEHDWARLIDLLIRNKNNK